MDAVHGRCSSPSAVVPRRNYDSHISQQPCCIAYCTVGRLLHLRSERAPECGLPRALSGEPVPPPSLIPAVLPPPTPSDWTARSRSAGRILSLPSVAVSSCSDAMVLDHRRPGAVLRVGSRPDQPGKNARVPPRFAWQMADIAEHPFWIASAMGTELRATSEAPPPGAQIRMKLMSVDEGARHASRAA